MCNFIYFSTDSEEDLEKLPRELFRVFPTARPQDEQLDEVLEFARQWYLECRYGGCSCHFRHHDGDRDLRFLPPIRSAVTNNDQDEDDDIIESTQAAYDLFSRLVNAGHRLDIFDSYNDGVPAKLETVQVSLGEVGREAFRFLEHKRMVLSP